MGICVCNATFVFLQGIFQYLVQFFFLPRPLDHGEICRLPHKTQCLIFLSTCGEIIVTLDLH